MPHKSLVVACSACTAAAACTAYWLWFSSGSRKHQQDAEEIPVSSRAAALPIDVRILHLRCARPC